jgi:hypothetical protein
MMKQNFQKNASGRFRIRETETQERKFNANHNLDLVNSLNGGHRLEIFIDGKFQLGASFGGEEPKCSYDLHELLKKLITDKHVW